MLTFLFSLGISFETQKLATQLSSKSFTRSPLVEKSATFFSITPRDGVYILAPRLPLLSHLLRRRVYKDGACTTCRCFKRRCAREARGTKQNQVILSVASLCKLGRRRYRETYRATAAAAAAAVAAAAVERGTRTLIGGGGVSPPPVSDGDTARSRRPVPPLNPRRVRRLSHRRMKRRTRCSSSSRVPRPKRGAIGVELSVASAALPKK